MTGAKTVDPIKSKTMTTRQAVHGITRPNAIGNESWLSPGKVVVLQGEAACSQFSQSVCLNTVDDSVAGNCLWQDFQPLQITAMIRDVATCEMKLLF